MPFIACSRPNYLPKVNRRTVFFSQNQQFDVNPRNASIDRTVYKGQVYAGHEDLYQFSYTEMHNKVSCKYAVSSGPLSYVQGGSQEVVILSGRSEPREAVSTRGSTRETDGKSIGPSPPDLTSMALSLAFHWPGLAT